MTEGRNLHRPYLFKDFGFHLEQEVRFVIRTNPEATSLRGGALIRIRAKDLFAFRFSDDIPDIEQHSLQALANEKLSQEVTISKHDSQFDFLNPLSAPNEPPGVFRDFDCNR